VFILLAIPVGVLAGYLLGGRLDRLSELHFRWAGVAIAGLLVQVVLFAEAVGGALGPDLGAVIYVASAAAVLVAVVLNARLPGIPILAIGATLNLAAILANGGVMPTTNDALRAAGLADQPGFSNSAVLADPALAPLTDIYALPAWFPLANVFSIGDVLIGLGVAVLLALGMRERRQGARLNR
jgi:hypothetical protein